MANAFIPDDKRRHQYFPVNEEPPDYDIASGQSSIGPSTSTRVTRPSDGQRRSTGARVRPAEREEENDDVDDLPSGDEDGTGHHAQAHRPDSEDSAADVFHELELETEPVKEPVLIRLTRKIHRITTRVDAVLYSYVNATLMRYIYGILLGIIVISLVYIFGGSLPQISVPKQYKEDALRIYINDEMSASNIRKFTEDFGEVYSRHPQVEAAFRSKGAANWVHTEFVKLGVARNAVDEYFVYFPRPEPDGQILEIRDSKGNAYTASLFDDKGRLLSFITHGASGNVTAPLVFTNYATPADFAWLSDSGIDVKKAIVIFKRDQRSTLATQIHTAQSAGASACIVYSSMADFGSGKGAVFPDGPWLRPDTSVNGDAAMTWIQPGDILTPGYPSSGGLKTLEPEESPAQPTIPAMSISATDAANILTFLKDSGVAIKSNWDVGQSAPDQIFTGSNDPQAPRVTLLNLLKDERKHQINDVLSEIEGIESDQVLLIGTSMSDISSVAILMEVARIFADLATKYNWKPRRSMIFAVWDATAANYIGSTEWAENQLKSLRHQGIAYINLANAASLSGRVSLRATPSLSDALFQAMDHVTNAFGNASVAEDLGLSTLSDTAEPSGFSDSIAFESYVGMAVADLGYPDLGLSFECLSSAECIHHHIDPDFVHHNILAKTLAMVVLELSDERFIPLDIFSYARAIESGIQSLSKKYRDLNFGGDLVKVIQELDHRTDVMMQWKNEWQAAYLENKEIETPAWSVRRSNWNYAVALFHRNLLRSNAWTTWFEQPIYGPSRHVNEQGERSWTFPHIEDAYATGDLGKAQGSVDLLGQTIYDAVRALEF